MFHTTFAEVTNVLEAAGAEVPTAESHGCLCGALCTFENYPMARWLEEILPDTAISSALNAAANEHDALGSLYADTVRALRGDEMEFTPLLPDDDTPIKNRADALAKWCQGFLYGLGTGSRLPQNRLPGNVDEVLRDFTELSRAEGAEGDGTEEEEQAYSELIEYLRVSVQLVHDELVELRETKAH